MKIGERIRLIRLFRGLTQRELGELVNQLDVRIREYESGRRTPKEDKLKELANALNISYSALHPNSVYEEFMENLFWAEEMFGEIDLFSFSVQNDKPKNVFMPVWKYDAKYNRYDEERWLSNVPIGLTFNNPTINDFFREWLVMKNELAQGNITRDDYFEWKINWPESNFKNK